MLSEEFIEKSFFPFLLSQDIFPCGKKVSDKINERKAFASSFFLRLPHLITCIVSSSPLQYSVHPLHIAAISSIFIEARSQGKQDNKVWESRRMNVSISTPTQIRTPTFIVRSFVCLFFVFHTMHFYFQSKIQRAKKEKGKTINQQINFTFSSGGKIESGGVRGFRSQEAWDVMWKKIDKTKEH